VREPVLRLSAFLRAFGFRTDSGEYRVGNTDNPGTQLGQTPMRSPSVFNFYRPGYVPPGTAGGHGRPGGAGNADRPRDHRGGLRELHARQRVAGRRLVWRHAQPARPAG
jgi:hypothetical protein